MFGAIQITADAVKCTTKNVGPRCVVVQELSGFCGQSFENILVLIVNVAFSSESSLICFSKNNALLFCLFVLHDLYMTSFIFIGLFEN